MFGDSLAVPIGPARNHRVRCAGVVLGNVRQLGRLAAVHRARTGQQKLLGLAVPGEVERVPRPRDDRIEHQQRVLFAQPRARFGRRVNHVRKLPGWKGEIPHVPLVARDGRIEGQVRRLRGERLPVARQDDDLAPKPELLVGPEKALQQPRAEEPGAAGDEDPLIAQRFPQPGGVFENVLAVGGKVHVSYPAHAVCGQVGAARA